MIDQIGSTPQTDYGLLVWWTSEADCHLISAMFSRWRIDEDASEGDGPTNWPAYLSKEYNSRFGRNGRGQLWVAKRFGQVGIVPWPESDLSETLGRFHAGIVIASADLLHVSGLPGFVTDLSLSPYLGE